MSNEKYLKLKERLNASQTDLNDSIKEAAIIEGAKGELLEVLTALQMMANHMATLEWDYLAQAIWDLQQDLMAHLAEQDIEQDGHCTNEAFCYASENRHKMKWRFIGS